MVERRVENIFAVYSNKRTSRRNYKSRRVDPCGLCSKGLKETYVIKESD